MLGALVQTLMAQLREEATADVAKKAKCEEEEACASATTGAVPAAALSLCSLSLARFCLWWSVGLMPRLR